MRYPTLKLLCALILATTFLPTVVNTQTDPRCWTREDCVAARLGSALANDQNAAEDGFYAAAKHPEAAICGEKDSLGRELGFCLPATKTVTEISFGGKREFANIGEFIQLIYRYAIIIAGILATIIIILAGIRWTASGGNAERIKSAQKMIGGAISGLLIALLSYTILSALNPATVNLRLPQVWLINRQGLPVAYCDQYPKEPGLEPIKRDAQLTREQTETIRREGKFATKKNSAQCGTEYLLAGQDNQTCKGLSCAPPEEQSGTGIGPPSGQVCTPSLSDKKFSYQCQPGVLAGTIAGVSGLFAGTDLTGASAQAVSTDTESDDLIDVIQLIALCNDGTIDEVASAGGSFKGLDGPDPNNTYVVPATIPEIDSACGSLANVAGFYLGAEVNDEGSNVPLVARPGDTLSAGKDDWFAIGQIQPGSHDCSLNLAKLAVNILEGINPKCALNECTCALLSDKKIGAALAKDERYKKHLISPEEMSRGYVCDITISRGQFPAADNGDFINLKSAGAAAIAGVIFTPAAGLVAGAVVGTITGFDDPTSCFDKS